MAKSTKVCAYVMTHDSGLAPNPFHGVCTLAVCTPNHVRANLATDDYIIGVAGVRLREKLNSVEHRLIYVMKVDKIMGLNEYYNSLKYNDKIPKRSGSKLEMCGDNFYKFIDGKLSHTGESTEHDWREVMEKDCYGNRVFIGESFSYFGTDAPIIPQGCNWGLKLTQQFRSRSIGITYILGGSGAIQWDESDLNEFLGFAEEQKNNLKKSQEKGLEIENIPTPIDFDNWISEPENRMSCTSKS